MITTHNLYQHARALNINITTHTSGAKGYYTHETRTISLRANLTERERRSTLAHELGHAVRGDEPTHNPYFHQRQERRADEYAANLLITPGAYAALEAQYGTAYDQIAYELGLTTHLLHVWRAMRQRAAA